MKIYSIRDIVSATFDKPFLFTNDAIALRSLKEVINNPKSSMQYINDKQLFVIGEMDLSTGIITPSTPRLVKSFTDLLEVKETTDNGKLNTN